MRKALEPPVLPVLCQGENVPANVAQLQEQAGKGHIVTAQAPESLLFPLHYTYIYIYVYIYIYICVYIYIYIIALFHAF